MVPKDSSSDGWLKLLKMIFTQVDVCTEVTCELIVAASEKAA